MVLMHHKLHHHCSILKKNTISNTKKKRKTVELKISLQMIYLVLDLNLLRGELEFLGSCNIHLKLLNIASLSQMYVICSLPFTPSQMSSIPFPSRKNCRSSRVRKTKILNEFRTVSVFQNLIKKKKAGVIFR